MNTENINNQANVNAQHSSLEAVTPKINYLYLIILSFLECWGYIPNHNLHAFKYLLYHILSIAEYIKHHGSTIHILKTLNMFCFDENFLQELEDDDSEGTKHAKSLAEDLATKRYDEDNDLEITSHHIWRGYFLATRAATVDLVLDYSPLIALADKIISKCEGDEDLIDKFITDSAHSMVNVCKKRIFVRYEYPGGSIGRWCNLDDFFEEIMIADIIANTDNSPTITVDGKLCIDWVDLLINRKQGESMFKYKISENEYLYFCY